MQQFTLPHEAQIVEALTPATDAAGRNGAWVNLKHGHKAYIKVHINQGNAATVALNIDQAQDVAGTGAKAITKPVKIWAALDVGTTDVLAPQTDATSFTTDAAVKSKIVLFEIDPATLDMANGFNVIRVKTGASNVANVTEATYLVTPLRFKANMPPSAIV